MAEPNCRRFPFGRNWLNFLQTLDAERIREAELSLGEMLGRDDLQGLSFLDAGSGSGLFSLAARRMGAITRSFDLDPDSIACTRELRQMYAPDDPNWVVEQGSALDETYLNSLGRFDVVYSWGVLHHTGDMWRALELVSSKVRRNGLLYIAIYNDQGFRSRFWARVKKFYNRGAVERRLTLAGFLPVFFVYGVVIGLLQFRNPLGYFVNYKRNRGMSIYYDWIDWLGGYPYEVARPEEVLAFLQQLGFSLERERLASGLGCNQFVFRLRP